MFEDTVSQDNFSPVQQPSTMSSAGRGMQFCTERMFDVSPQCFGRGRTFLNVESDHVHTSDSGIGTSSMPAACSTPCMCSNTGNVVVPESLGGLFLI